MEPVKKKKWTEAEYLDQERRSLEKHEFINSEIFAMAGASPAHNLVSINIAGSLNTLLASRPCVALGSDQRIYVPATQMFTYPDVTVVCGPMQFYDKDPLSLTNPLVLIEVLSDSTKDYDRGAKFAHYRSIPSLAEVLLVAQNERLIEHYRRLETGQWLLTEYRQGEIPLPCLSCTLSLDAIYAKVDLVRG